VISILGLISLFYLFLIFICIISYQCNYYKNGSDKGSKCCYFWGIIIFIGLIITPLIYSCNIISKVKYAKEKYGYNDIFSTFKILNMIFVILGFALILFLIVYIILVPFKFCFKENKGNETHENKTSFSTENIK
jgi:heme/copper-type cytochrome/quinol oxidase subunit 2